MAAHSVIIHDLTQAHIAVDMASTIGVQLELRSPLGAAANIGPAVFQEIAKEIEQTRPDVVTAIILDCGSDAGLAMAALRQGCRDICINVPEEASKKIKAIAAVMTARLHDQATSPLDLGKICSSDKRDLIFLRTALRNFLCKDRAIG